MDGTLTTRIRPMTPAERANAIFSHTRERRQEARRERREEARQVAEEKQSEKNASEIERRRKIAKKQYFKKYGRLPSTSELNYMLNHGEVPGLNWEGQMTKAEKSNSIFNRARRSR